jgi:hypothetical protein
MKVSRITPAVNGPGERRGQICAQLCKNPGQAILRLRPSATDGVHLACILAR